MRFFARLNVWLLSLGAALHAFDVRYLTIHVVQPDSLIHYNMLLTWLRHGDSPRGVTLTPSPYFVDMLLQLPMMLLTRDFEQFSYVLGFVYAALLVLAVLVVTRTFVAELTTVGSVAVAGIVLAAVYHFAPFDFVVHLFVFNHTSEIFTTLGLVALLHAWFRPGARRRRYAAPVYAALLAFLVMSSPWFIVTYCMPTTLAVAALLGTAYVDRRRFAWFLGLTAGGALAGLVVLAFVARYVWVLRVDRYGKPAAAFHTLVQWIQTEPGGMTVAKLVAIAFVASITLAIVGRRRGWPERSIFALAFVAAAIACPLATVIKRGVFYGGYEFRYFTFTLVVVVTFYVALAAQLGLALARRARLRERLERLPRWWPWSAGVLGVLAIALAADCGGPLSIDDPRSLTAPMLECFHDAEQHAGLQDGLATWLTARYFNAALHSSSWDSSHVVVEIDYGRRELDARDNNLMWFDGEYRHGEAHLNYLVTQLLDDDALASYTSVTGPPDRTVTCPVPPNLRMDRKDTLQIWIWDRPEAQRALAELVTHDPVAAFALGTPVADIDPKWAMSASPELPPHQTVSTVPMYLPNGHYRAELDLAGDASIARVIEEPAHVLAHTDIAPRQRHLTVEFQTRHGAPTSGQRIRIEVRGQSVEVTKLSLILVERASMSPFQIFK